MTSTIATWVTTENVAAVTRELATVRRSIKYLLKEADGYPMQIRIGVRYFVFSTEEDLKKIIGAVKQQVTTFHKNSFLQYLSDLQTKVPMAMFRAMHKAIQNDDIKAAWSFYKNDLDKLDHCGSDLEIRNTIEEFFRNLNQNKP